MNPLAALVALMVIQLIGSFISYTNGNLEGTCAQFHMATVSWVGILICLDRRWK